jgi:alpha-ketoglutarate-dependent taurine dioxygenase
VLGHLCLERSRKLAGIVQRHQEAEHPCVKVEPRTGRQQERYGGHVEAGGDERMERCGLIFN